MSLAYFADGTTLDEFDHAAIVRHAMNLRAHLRGDSGLCGSLGDQSRFSDITRERLLAIHGLLHLQRGHRGIRVRVLGGADDDAVDLRFLDRVVEFAEIAEGLRAFEGIGSAVEVLAIHIADGDDVFTWLGQWRRCFSCLGVLWAHQRHADESLDIGGSTSADTDEDEIQF